jgi:Na+-driven multidrug efflux pump
MELFPFFHQIFKILILFVLYFKNHKRQMVSWNCKHVQYVKIYLPCNFEVNLIIHFGVIALFSSFFFSILILFVLYFKNYKRWMLSLHCKDVQHVKIYIPCNFEVNPITHFGVIALNVFFYTFRPLFQKL